MPTVRRKAQRLARGSCQISQPSASCRSRLAGLRGHAPHGMIFGAGQLLNGEEERPADERHGHADAAHHEPAVPQTPALLDYLFYDPKKPKMSIEAVWRHMSIAEESINAIGLRRTCMRLCSICCKGPAHARSACIRMAAAVTEVCLCLPLADMTTTAELLCQTRGAAGTRLCGCFASQRRNTAEFGGR